MEEWTETSFDNKNTRNKILNIVHQNDTEKASKVLKDERFGVFFGNVFLKDLFRIVFMNAEGLMVDLFMALEDFDTMGYSDDHPLFFSAFYGKRDTVMKIVRHPGFDFSKTDWNFFHVACAVMDRHLLYWSLNQGFRAEDVDEAGRIPVNFLFFGKKDEHSFGMEISALQYTLIQNVPGIERSVYRSLEYAGSCCIDALGEISAVIESKNAHRGTNDYKSGKYMGLYTVIRDQSASGALVLILFCSQGFYGLVGEDEMSRFFKMAMQVPPEIQMRICLLLYGSRKNFVSNSLLTTEIENECMRLSTRLPDVITRNPNLYNYWLARNKNR